MNRWLAALTIGLVATAVTAGAAKADGLPVVGIEAGPAGVPAEDGDVRYVTLRAGGGTLLAKIAQSGGEVIRSAFLRDRFSVPVVAFDGSTSGLSNDGRTLVLVRPRVAFPQGRTALRRFRREPASPASAADARRRFQLRRALPGRPPALSHRVRQAAGPDSLPGPGARPGQRAPPPGDDRRSQGAGRGDARLSDHP